MSQIDIDAIAARMDAILWPERNVKQRRKRERILLGAVELFVRLGYRKTNIDDVARQAGVAKGTVYLYYRNKADLVYHAIVFEKRAHLDRMVPLNDPLLSATEQLRGLIALGVLMSREMPLTTSLIRGDHEIELALREMGEQVLAEVNTMQTEFMVGLVDAATGHSLPPAELAKRGQVLVDLMAAATMSNRLNPGGLPWAEYATALADFIVFGVAAPRDTQIPAFLAPDPDAEHESTRTGAQR